MSGEATRTAAPWRVRLAACRRGRGVALAFVLGGALISAFASLAPASSAASEPCPNAAFRTGYSANLPDCRAYEQVTPVEKGTTRVGTALGVTPYQAAGGGGAVVYPALGALPGSPEGGETINMGVRDVLAGGWLTTPLSPPSLLGNVFASGRYRWLSEELSCAVVESREPLSEEPSAAATQAAATAAETSNLYRRNADGSWTLLSNATPLNPTFAKESQQYTVFGATADCARVFFDTTNNNYRLLPEAPAGKLSVYEWDAGTLRLADVLPDGSVPAEGIAQGYSSSGIESPWNLVSEDGSRMIFAAKSDEGADSGNSEVFMREGNGTPAAHTVEVSKSETATPDGRASFQAASRKAARVFFTANYKLASTSSTGLTACNPASSASGCDLYVYEPDAPTSKLTDLSADSNTADTTGADVAGVLGISEDGSYVYFAATGQLVLGKGNTQATNESKKEMNVYVAHAGTLAFAGTITLGEAQNDGSGAALLTFFHLWSSRVTPDGRHLSFVSKTNVTGYNNSDAVTGTPDAEAYLYSAETGQTVCVSCNPSGALPISGSKERTPIAEPEWAPAIVTSGVPRALSQDGDHVFFTSPDPLSPLVKPGQENVYEWERAGTEGGSCTTSSATFNAGSGGCVYLLDSGAPGITGEPAAARFLDAGASGEDVFIQTTARLVPQDADNLVDVYDVRVLGGFPPPAAPPPPPCEGEACQGLATGAPAFGAPSSATFSGAGNLPPPAKPKPLTRAQKLAKALKACAKKTKRQRATCEARARKLYGAKSKAKKSDVRRNGR